MLSLLTGPAWSQGTADTAAGSAADSAAKAAAIEAFKAGQRSYAQGDMTTALGHFNAAYELDPNPTLMFNLANVYAALDRPKESVRYFRLYLRDAPPEMRQEDEAAVTALMQRLKLRMEDLEPQVEDPPYDPRPTFRTSGWISLGLGAVALGVGTVYGFQLQGFEDDHRAATTAREKARTRDEGEFAESMASGMLVAGGILAGAGALFLWLGAEDDGGPSESGIIVGPGQVGWSMSW
ncbi:MAG: tetratricopeptide repeat protein [Bradymonadia bacterium]